MANYLINNDTTASQPAFELDLVPRRHPWRWVGAAAVAVFLVSVVWILATAPAMRWDVVGHYLFDADVLRGVRNTLLMTVLAMVIGMALGTLVAVMRLSVNPVLIAMASLYQWFFRGTPTLVQLIFWFNLASIFPHFRMTVLGVDVIDVGTNDVMTPLLASLLGLGLNFAAYYSEVIRAGILSVDDGQTDAAQAYGLTRVQTLRHIILPQAMRVIIPPTGNELIGMLKWTSLASVVAYSELLHSVQDVYNRTYEVIPLLTVAAIWYLALTTVLTIGQRFLEKRFNRGSQRAHEQSSLSKKLRALRGRQVTA
ncbi:amino acid ABC transporter permease [Streptomyces fractus]|uniref:amino acid ABC transporter permease n=1 Tax=Streptomyces fractus TaxID=641806 RepID=UPI003CEBE733